MCEIYVLGSTVKNVESNCDLLLWVRSKQNNKEKKIKARDVLRAKVPFIDKVVHSQRYLFILTISREKRGGGG